MRISHETGPIAGANFPGTITFAAGGALASTDTQSPATGLGTWVKKEDGGFQLTFQEFIFQGPAKGGKFKIRADGTVQGDSLEGRFSFNVLAPDGQSVATGGGTFKGTRIRVDAG